MLREFTDGAGTTWSVWDVYPTSRSSTQGAVRAVRSAGPETVMQFSGHDLSDGWLCFESPSEKRRLVPIPPEWEICESCALEEFCTRAGQVRLTPAEAMDSARIAERG